MASEKERQNFFCLTLLLFRVGNEKLRNFFKSQWPTAYQKVTGALPAAAWTDIPNDATTLIAVETALRLQHHETTKFNTGNTNEWDMSLLISILLHSSLGFVSNSSPERQALLDLKDIRNTLIGHAADAKITETTFTIHWQKACNAVKVFNATQDEIKAVQNDVKKPLADLLPILTECVRQEKDILDGVNLVHKKLDKATDILHQVKSMVTVVTVLFPVLLGIGVYYISSQYKVPEVKAIYIIIKDVNVLPVLVVGVIFLASAIFLWLKVYPFYVVTLYTRKLRRSIECGTEVMSKLMASHSITSLKLDDIFTNVLVQRGRKPVQRDQTQAFSRRERLEDYSRLSDTSVEKCADIFLNRESEKSKRLLVVGKPGIGKTLFCQKVIRDWAKKQLFTTQDKKLIPDFKFAYLLTFRQLSLIEDKELNLQEFLNQSTLLDEQTNIDRTTLEYIVQHPEEVLIILDGYDEYSHREEIIGENHEKYPNDPNKKMPVPLLCAKILRGKILKDSVVLVSSRPGDADKLGVIDFEQYEITGFSSTQVLQFVDRYFRENEQIKNTVRQHIENTQSLVSLCHVPVLCFLVCWVMEWYCTRPTSAPAHLPVNTTELYTQVMEIFNLKHNSESEYKNKEIPEKYQVPPDIFTGLTKFAAKLLQEKKYVFNEEDMEAELSEQEIANLKASGLLHCGPGERKSSSLINHSFQFLHLTVQEFLSAQWFVAMNKIPEKQTSEMVLQFMSGLLARKNDEMMTQIFETVKPENIDDNEQKLLSLRCLGEYRDEKLADKLLYDNHHLYCHSDGMIGFTRVTDMDCTAISWLLDSLSRLQVVSSRSELRRVKVLHIDNSQLTLSGVQSLCVSVSRLSTVTALWLWYCNLDDKCAVCIGDIITNTNITRLYLPGNNITDKGAKYLCFNVVRDSCTVTFLNLSLNKLITYECRKALRVYVRTSKPGVLLDI